MRGGSLVITSVRGHHASRYACSSNPESPSRVVVKLVVYEPLSVIVAPNPLVS